MATEMIEKEKADKTVMLLGILAIFGPHLRICSWKPTSRPTEKDYEKYYKEKRAKIKSKKRKKGEQ